MWRPEPPPGTACAGGFDGSETDDWTAIRLETRSGHRFTPRYGPDRRPTVWNPGEWGGKIPRDEIDAAWDELDDRFRLARVYCDPPGYRTEIGEWARKHGEEKFLEWATYRVVPMHAALARYYTDLSTGRTTHDGCPLTRQAALNARKLARPGQRYILAKPAQHQKIDPVMADVLAHEAAADAREAGWDDAPKSRYTRVTGAVRTY